MLEEPELVTLIPEEEPPPPPISPEFKIVGRFLFDATLVVAVKVIGVFAVRRLVKSARAMNDIKFPENWYRNEEW